MSATSLPAEGQLLIHDVFQAGLVDALMTGVYTTVVVYTMHKIVTGKHGLKFAFRPLVALMIVMYICAVVHFAVRWTRNTLSFVDHGISQEDTLESLLQKPPASSTVLALTRGLMMLIADYIMIWRCWRFYEKSWMVIALPLCLLAGELASLACQLVYMQQSEVIVTSSDTVGKILLTHLSFTLATTVLTTILIVVRLVRMGASFWRYCGISAIIVESSLLYTIAIVVHLPFTVSSTLTDFTPRAFVTFIPGIAATLIIARVDFDAF